MPIALSSCGKGLWVVVKMGFGGLVECVGIGGGQLGYAVVVGRVGQVVGGLLVVVVIGCTPGGSDPDTGGCYMN